jgi:hypothetical protein
MWLSKNLEHIPTQFTDSFLVMFSNTIRFKDKVNDDGKKDMATFEEVREEKKFTFG